MGKSTLSKNYLMSCFKNLCAIQKKWADLQDKGISHNSALVKELPIAVRTLEMAVNYGVPFALPDGGNLLGDKTFAPLRGLPLKLPYPVVTLEYDVDTDIKTGDGGREYARCRVLIVAISLTDEEHNWSGVMVTSFSKFIPKHGEDDEQWLPSPLVLYIPEEWEYNADLEPLGTAAEYDTNESPYTRQQEGIENVPEKYKRDHGFRAMLNEWLPTCCDEAANVFVESGGTKEKFIQSMQQDMIEAGAVLLNFCSALACTNIEVKRTPGASRAVNAKRVRKGKLPLLDVHTLVVRTPGGHTEPIAIGDGTEKRERNGPRQYLKRGHIRHCASGKVTWVQPHVCGNPERGVIQKDYALTAE